jgi:manganese/zinc/iron transport system permease protein
MSWTSIDTWIVVTGVLCAMACALPGCFLVLRKMSMMGDAISHAVLPGLAIAFLVGGSRASFPMFLGAAVTGVLTAVFTQWIGRFANVDRGAAMGVVFTTLFAIGLVLIVQAADHVDLDPGCVLYGAIEFTPLDTVKFGSLELPRAAAVNGGVLLFNATVIALLYKELKLSAFDPALAETLGFSSSFLHYLLMTMVAVTTVAAFESVGSIIVIAMLIVPAATAQLLTRRLLPMLLLGVILAAASAVLGHLGALLLPGVVGFESTTTSGMMAFAAGLIFLLAWIFAPREGLLMRHFGGLDAPDAEV